MNLSPRQRKCAEPSVHTGTAAGMSCAGSTPICGTSCRRDMTPRSRYPNGQGSWRAVSATGNRWTISVPMPRERTKHFTRNTHAKQENNKPHPRVPPQPPLTRQAAVCPPRPRRLPRQKLRTGRPAIFSEFCGVQFIRLLRKIPLWGLGGFWGIGDSEIVIV